MYFCPCSKLCKVTLFPLTCRFRSIRRPGIVSNFANCPSFSSAVVFQCCQIGPFLPPLSCKKCNGGTSRKVLPSKRCLLEKFRPTAIWQPCFSSGLLIRPQGHSSLPHLLKESDGEGTFNCSPYSLSPPPPPTSPPPFCSSLLFPGLTTV